MDYVVDEGNETAEPQESQDCSVQGSWRAFSSSLTRLSLCTSVSLLSLSLLSHQLHGLTENGWHLLLPRNSYLLWTVTQQETELLLRQAKELLSNSQERDRLPSCVRVPIHENRGCGGDILQEYVSFWDNLVGAKKKGCFQKSKISQIIQ